MSLPRMAKVFRREAYARLAQSLNSSKPTKYASDDCRYQWRQDCEVIANMLADQSSGFDRALFLTNCGVENADSLYPHRTEK